MGKFNSLIFSLDLRSLARQEFFNFRVEAGTLLASVEVAVACNLCFRESSEQLFQQRSKYAFLLLRSGVGTDAFGIAATYVAHAYAVVVPATSLTVGTLIEQWSPVLNGAVGQYDVVVAYHLEAPSYMPVVDDLGIAGLSGQCVRTMYNNVLYVFFL